MATPDFWNHNNYAVPPQNLPLVEECIGLLFPWEQYVKRPGFLGYRLQEDSRKAVVFFQGHPWAAKFVTAVERLRKTDKELGEALDLREQHSSDQIDHNGFRVETLEDWERRVATAQRIEKTRPDLQVKVRSVHRPGQPGAAPRGDLYQCFIRVGLLGPVRNTFEMVYVKAGGPP